MKTIGIVGNTYVGAATSLLGNHHAMRVKETKMLLYDEDPALCSHEGITMKDLSGACDFIFICIPTPMSPDGGCSTYEVKKAVFELLDSGYDSERIVVRSTVSVGTCKDLGVMFMPEFLTESKWKEDFITSFFRAFRRFFDLTAPIPSGFFECPVCLCVRPSKSVSCLSR